MKPNGNVKSGFTRSARVGDMRGGFTLVEMAVVSTLSVMLFALAVTVLITLDRQEEQNGLRIRQASDLARLADQFRADVHAAESIDDPSKDQPSGLVAVCNMQDGTKIEYLHKKKHLIRVATNSQGEEKHERFLISPQTTFGLKKIAPHVAEGSPPEPVETQRGQLVKLVLRWPIHGQHQDATRQLSIVAQSGRDLPVRLEPREANDDAP